MSLHFYADGNRGYGWDAALTADGTGYLVVHLHRSRWRQVLARLTRRPTHEVYPVQVHQPPTDAEIEAGAEVQRFTVGDE